jgi:hypothetical protein
MDTTRTALVASVEAHRQQLTATRAEVDARPEDAWARIALESAARDLKTAEQSLTVYDANHQPGQRPA